MGIFDIFKRKEKKEPVSSGGPRGQTGDRERSDQKIENLIANKDKYKNNQVVGDNRNEYQMRMRALQTGQTFDPSQFKFTDNKGNSVDPGSNNSTMGNASGAEAYGDRFPITNFATEGLPQIIGTLASAGTPFGLIAPIAKYLYNSGPGQDVRGMVGDTVGAGITNAGNVAGNVINSLQDKYNQFTMSQGKKPNPDFIPRERVGPNIFDVAGGEQTIQDKYNIEDFFPMSRDNAPEFTTADLPFNERFPDFNEENNNAGDIVDNLNDVDFFNRRNINLYDPFETNMDITEEIGKANGGYMSGFPNQNPEESLTASDNIDDRIMKNLQFEKMAPGMMGYNQGGEVSPVRLNAGGPPNQTEILQAAGMVFFVKGDDVIPQMLSTSIMIDENNPKVIRTDYGSGASVKKMIDDGYELAVVDGSEESNKIQKIVSNSEEMKGKSFQNMDIDEPDGMGKRIFNGIKSLGGKIGKVAPMLGALDIFDAKNQYDQLMDGTHPMSDLFNEAGIGVGDKPTQVYNQGGEVKGIYEKLKSFNDHG